uniref:Uncharacterized protein n=1 Tax=Solibacter usitatus (strain Ellin6076) TaxID=234267 RepID=Q01W00_SOLUE
MATPAQVTANRANAQQSTGPSSAEGKAASSRNSLKFGLTARAAIIPGEDPAELEALTTQYLEEFDPAGAVEQHLVQTMIRAIWMQQRCDRVEAAYLNARVAALPEGTEHALGAAVIEDAAQGDVLHKIFRRHQAAEREWTRALDSLTRMQAQRFADEAEAEAESATALAPASATPQPANRLRFSDPPQLPARPANLALRL